MSEKIVLHRGYCIKSPPTSYHKWRKRLCSLTLEKIPNLVEFHDTYCKDFNLNLLSAKDFTAQSHHLVFSYFKDGYEEAKDNALKKFLADFTTVINYPTGVNKYKYVIKLLFGPIYNNREMFLCFEEKSDHQRWFRAFKNSSRADSLELAIRNPARKNEAILGFSSQTDIDSGSSPNPVEEKLTNQPIYDTSDVTEESNCADD